MAFLGRGLISKSSIGSSVSLSPLFLFRSYSVSASLPLSRIARSPTLLRLRPLTALVGISPSPAAIGGLRCFSTRPTTSSLNDPSPNWSNRPPKETILLDGCDFEHWLVVMEPPEGNPTRDEIIDSYIKTLAQVIGSDDEARMKIYSVSTRHYYAFGCLVSEELSYKIKALPRVRWVLPDSYLDVKNKDYGGEPFIDGKAVPYDPKYHEEWVRNNARANERSRRNDRPRNFDRSRNFERRRENMQNRDFQAQSRDAPPMPNRDVQNPTTMGGPPNRDVGPMGGNPNTPPGGGPPAGPSGYSYAPPSGGPTGGYSNMPPPSGGPPAGYSNMPNNSGPSAGYSNMPNNSRPPPTFSNMPNNSGPPPTYSNMPNNSGPPPTYSNMPNNSGPPSGGPPGGPSGGYPYAPPGGGPSSGYSNMPPSGGPPGGYSNMPNNSGPPQGYSNMPNNSVPPGGYSNMPNSGPPGGYSNMPNRDMGGMQNRDYQNSYMPNREEKVESMSGGSTYQTRDVPGRDY